MACGEFDLIARYFDRFKRVRRDVQLGIGDDCALLAVPEKQLVAVSTDTLVAGIHFLPDIDPADLVTKHWRSISAIWRRWAPILRGFRWP